MSALASYLLPPMPSSGKGWLIEGALLAASYYFVSPMLGAQSGLPALILALPVVRSFMTLLAAISVVKTEDALFASGIMPTEASMTPVKWAINGLAPLGLMYALSGYFIASSDLGALELWASYGVGVYGVQSWLVPMGY